MNRTLTLFCSIAAGTIAATAAILLTFPTPHSDAATTCPNMDETILNCKAQGMDYQMNTRPDGCKIASCIAPGTCPDFALEIRTCRLNNYDYKDFWDERQCHRAQCVTPAVTTDPGKCPMEWDDAKKKIANCESGAGFKAVVRESATCLVFITCERIEPQIVPGEVSCKKRVENGCTMIKCEDGYAYNSCGSSMTSSSAGSAIATPTVDACADIQMKAKDADDAYAADRHNRTKMNSLRKLKVQLRLCRIEAAKR